MKILGIAGKSQAGKTTCANWLSGLWMQKAGVIDHHFVNETGDLFVPVELEGEVKDTCIQFNRETMWLRECVYPFVKQYNFADPLKHFLISVFGAAWENCYGTNEQKNALSHIAWGKFSDEIRKKYKKKKSEKMTWRELMQVYGTDTVRAIDPDAWVRACLGNVLSEQSEFAIIPDTRFPNELNGIRDVGGKVLKFLRNPLNMEHDSETALDNIPNENFDAIIDNSEMSISEQNEMTIQVLKEWGWIDFDIVETEPEPEPKKELPKSRDTVAKLK